MGAALFKSLPKYLFVPLPHCYFSPSFDKHFPAAKTVPGLCLVKNISLALEMLTARPASATSQGGLRVPAELRPRERQPLGGDLGAADPTGCPGFWTSADTFSLEGLRPIPPGAQDEGHREHCQTLSLL